MWQFLPALLLAAVPQEPGGEEESKWSGSFDAGLTILSGNNDSITSTADVLAKYEDVGYRWIFEGNYAGVRQTDPTTGDAFSTGRLYRLAGEHHRFLDAEDNLYAYGKGSARSDEPNGLQIREDIGVGAGYTWRWDEDQGQFSLEAGPSYLRENNVGLLMDDSVNGRLAARLDWGFTESWKLLGRGEFFQSFDESDDRSFTGELSVRWNFQETWFLQGTAAVAWDNTPAPGFSSTDTRYVLAVGTTF
ncbi:MAG: DUF481 domain-containing protein [Planctomycetota bacterium]|nr:MAG: DUF481 domain-containing protein [Planctomycetota bacterium]